MNGKKWLALFVRKDVITPASLITLLGLSLCLIGAAKLNTPSGLWLIVLGRSMDLIDGPVSRATRPTRLGAGLDAGSDKIALLAIVVACFYYDLAPWWALLYILLHNVINTAMAVWAESRGKQPSTVVGGKLSMFGENIAILLFIIAAVPEFNTNSFFPAVLTLLISVPFGLWASYSYFRQAASHK